MGRRGHAAFSWGVLGVAFGPLAIPLAVSSIRREQAATPRLIGTGAAGPGPVDALVGVDGSPEATAALRTVAGLLGERLGRLTVAAVLDFDTAESDMQWGERQRALAELARDADALRGEAANGREAMETLSVIKADTGGWVGHSSVHPEMVKVAERALGAVKHGMLIDGYVGSCGDDLALIMTHEHGVDSEVVHGFAWDVFLKTTELARELGLYGAGQDLLSDAFSGNVRGMGPGCAELEFAERVSEPVIVFLADKTEPGAWNLPLYRIFADPFNTAGLVIDPKMHPGFLFEVLDLYENRRIVFDCPTDIYDLLLFIGSPESSDANRAPSS